MGTRIFAIVKDMLKSVYNLNELSLSDMLEAAFEMYPVRVVCADIIAPMMWEIGSMWERGEIMVVMEHFASNVVIAKLKGLLHKQNTTTNSKGPVVIVGCAPEEYHEIGALIVSFFMSLNGWKVVYLGQNIPPSDLLNIVDTMDVHTIALSASSERSLASLKVVGAHITSRAKRKKVEFLVGGRLLKMGENILGSIPSATTRSADDLYAYCPPTHPTHQDTMVRGALDGSYSLIRESYRKMRLASERRKRTQYLLDQITDDSVGAPEKEITGDELTQEFSESLEKIAEFSCDPADENEQSKEKEDNKGKRKQSNSSNSSNDEDSEGNSGKTPIITPLSPSCESPTTPIITSADDSSSNPSSSSSSPSFHTPSSSPTLSSSPTFSSSPSSNNAPSPSSVLSSSPSSSSSLTPSPISSVSTPSPTPKISTPSPTPKISTPSPTPKISTPSPTPSLSDSSSSSTTSGTEEDIKDRLDKQRKQTQAMKEMLKRYKDGKKAAEDSIARSRAFLNENRLVTAKPKTVIAPPKPATPEPKKVIPPAVVVPPSNEPRNTLVTQPKKRPSATTFIHMHDPSSAGEMYNLGPDKDEPYFPKYANVPRVGDTRDSSSNSSGMSDDDALLDEGIL